MATRMARITAACADRARQDFYVEKLYEVAYASPVPLENIALEFMYAVGAIYEGTPPEELKLEHISSAEFLDAVNKP